MKKLNIFLIALLIIGQSILGPIGTASASGIDGLADAAVAAEGNGEQPGDEPNGEQPGDDLNGEQPGDEPNGEQPGDEPNGEQPGDDPNGEQLGDEPDKEIILTNDMLGDVTFTINGQEVNSNKANVYNGDNAEFKIIIKQMRNTDYNYGIGTKLKYKLPEGFEDVFQNIDIDPMYGDVGDLTIEDGHIVITLEEGIIDPISGDPKTLTEGEFNISAMFSTSNTDWEKTITIPGGKTIELNFQPKEGSGVTIDKKNGVPNKNGKDSDQIDWEVIVNTNLANIDDNPVFTDELTATGEDENSTVGHKFKTDSVMLTEITVLPDGTLSEGSPTNVPAVFSEDNTKMEIQLDKNKAYKIKYSTVPDNPLANEYIVYKNKANYAGTPSSEKQARVEYGKAIEKIATNPGTDLIAKWEIRYNFNNQTILAADAELSDTWTTNGGDVENGEIGYQKLANFKVVTDSGTDYSEGTDYTLDYTEGGSGFTLRFINDVTEPLIITYETTPVHFVATKDFTVKNTVTRTDINKSDDASVTYSQTALTLVKKRGAAIPNYHDKTMDWIIEANQAGYLLKADTVFEDIFVNENMTLIEGSLRVTIDGTERDESTSDKGYVLHNNGTEGFTITLDHETSNPVKITYTTDYDIKEHGKNDFSYPNYVQLKESGLPGNPDSEVSYEIRDEQEANGQKDGWYNYEDKEFHWEVLFNFNYNKADNAIFTDKLPDTQVITGIKVWKGDLNPDGTFDQANATEVTGVGEQDAIGGYEIILKLGEIAGPYKVTYTSEKKDGIFPETVGNFSVTNEAELTVDGVSKGTWEKTVTVQHTEKVLENKTGLQIGNTMSIKWNFQFNNAQSALKDVVITDTFGLDNGAPNQIIDQDSFKVYEVNFNGTSSSINNRVLLDKGAYDVKFDDPDHAFILTLGDTDRAYFIEYESTFIGVKGSTISNEVEVKYFTEVEETGSDAVSEVSFNYGSDAGTRAAKFIIVKTDGATGSLMKDVEFTLLNKNGKELLTSKTDANGVLDFGYEMAEGVYTLVEGDVEGYTNPSPIQFMLDYDEREESGPFAGKQVVEIANYEEGYEGPTCPNFTLLVKDVDGELREEVVQLKLVNKNTGKTLAVATTGTGKVMIDREELPNGPYEVFEINGLEETKIDDIAVNYDDCLDEVQPAPSCDVFTITVTENVPDGEGRPNVEVTLKDKEGNDIATSKTDSDGKIQIPSSDLPAGTYDVYEGNFLLGEINVSYKDDCQAQVTYAPSCPTFTLTVKDRGNNPREAGVEITVQDLNGNTIEKAVTDDNGQVELNAVIGPGTYRVYEGTRLVNSFTVTDECYAEVRQRSSGGGGGGGTPPTPPKTCDVFTLTVKEDGEALDADAEFTLRSETKEVSGKTDANGKIVFDKADLPEGTYSVYDGDNDRVGSVTVKYTEADCQAEIDMNPKVCEVFTVTVKEQGKTVGSNVELKLKSATTDIFSKTDANGKIVFDKENLPAGTYTAYDKNGTNVGTVTVTYDYNDCRAEVDLNPIVPKACEVFTVTVKEQGKTLGSNVELTLKSGTTEVVGKTDANGKIVFDKEDLPEGTYTAYDKNGEEVGTITVTYTEGKCAAEIDLNPKACETFTLTVTDTPNADVVLKDKNGNTVATGKTDAKGKVVFDKPILEGNYEVYVQGKNMGSLTVTDSCTATINPEVPEEPEEPVDPEDPNQPGKPDDGEDPNEPGEPDDGVKGPNQPGQPGDGTEDPNAPGTGGSIDPDQPDQNVDSSNKLPQTGEEQFMYMIALGLLFLTAGGVILFRQRRKV